ncbi:hypothetical protein LGN19_08020 [Burkholderia sp. AU30198]|uniref:hypothetical protein n=1 Tax=Burkholderia sp. AU30198 TaxID=2879627 RepID=UPI001CF306B3|nr:hypothetical protein [Burkholderia sp. AU30198]MCA8293732.1 hypothetical protein [Burkholderia sp. AU30198]
MNSMDVLKKFVSGEMSPLEFEKILCVDKNLEDILSESPPIPPYAEEGGLYLFLVSSSYRSLGAIWDAQDAVHQFLHARGVSVMPSNKIQSQKGEMRKVLPKWLRISDEMYGEIRQSAAGLAGAELISFMKGEMERRFVCLSKPPKWIQDEFWPVSDGEPLIFVGQLDVSKVRHDTSYVYVFLGKSGKYVTIEQSM